MRKPFISLNLFIFWKQKWVYSYFIFLVLLSEDEDGDDEYFHEGKRISTSLHELKFKVYIWFYCFTLRFILVCDACYTVIL